MYILFSSQITLQNLIDTSTACVCSYPYSTPLNFKVKLGEDILRQRMRGFYICECAQTVILRNITSEYVLVRAQTKCKSQNNKQYIKIMTELRSLPCNPRNIGENLVIKSAIK